MSRNEIWNTTQLFHYSVERPGVLFTATTQQVVAYEIVHCLSLVLQEVVLNKVANNKQHFVGSPKPEDFDLVEEELPQLKDGDLQFRALFLRTLPMRMTLHFTMFGRAVGVVEHSQNQEFPVGCTIVHTA